MFKEFIKQLEKRVPLEDLFVQFGDLFQSDSAAQRTFSAEGFARAVEFVEKGEASFQGIACQAGARWSTAAQKVKLRAAILERGFLTPSCLWAYVQLRGRNEELLQDFSSPEMGLMQIVLLKGVDPAMAAPFLLERFLTGKDVSEELRAASRLCLLRLLDSWCAPDDVKRLLARFPDVEILAQWRPGIPGRPRKLKQAPRPGSIDFHQLVRSVNGIKELSSLTRILYLASQFYIPLSEKEWNALFLSGTDAHFFGCLLPAGIVESFNGGYLLAGDSRKQELVRQFLYESYDVAKESVHRLAAKRMKEDRKRRVRTSELDRHALEMVPDGIVAVDRSGQLYYANTPAEKILTENTELKKSLFGGEALSEVLGKYTPERVLSRVKACVQSEGLEAEIFGNRASIMAEGKKFEVKLGRQVMLLRDCTDQYLIDQEIGKLYRHEMKAALDVLGVGLTTAKELVEQGKTEQGLEFLEQVEHKRNELCTMLEERIDFIRLHSDAFEIRPEVLNLNLVVDKSIYNYRDMAKSKGVSIKSNHLHVGAVCVQGEERFLVRAFDNIIRNALKFSNQGSEIRITVDSDAKESLVRIEDDGPGIPSQNLGKIFQLGFTTGGSGRGLYLARRIVTAHDGRISVKSRLGHGASFTVRLPAAKES